MPHFSKRATCSAGKSSPTTPTPFDRPFAPDGMDQEHSGTGGPLDRADRLIGCLIWKPLAAFLTVASAAAGWMAFRILRETRGTERLAGVVLALAVAVVMGVGAWRTARRRRFSEGDFDA